jgi:hypothetical protein
MTIEFERQQLRALALQPIRQLQAYSADHTVACRAGGVIAFHIRGITPGTYAWDLEKVLSATALRAKFPSL